jgi:hypothetical protein
MEDTYGMTRTRPRRWITAILFALATLALIAVCLCWHFNVWSLEDYRQYGNVLKYAPGRDLWLGTIRAGHSLDDFTRRHPPHEKTQKGEYAVMGYYITWPTPPNSIQMEQLYVVAKDSRLVAAGVWSCCWNKEFFNVLKPEERDILDK